MTYEELAMELERLFPGVLEKASAEDARELRSLELPQELKAFYAKRGPKSELAIGRFRMPTVSGLIDLNVWDETGEALYGLGLSVVGRTADGGYVCLDMAGANSAGSNDVLLAPADIEPAGMDLKKARAAMKFQAAGLGELLSKELAFCRKAQTAGKKGR
ncbi:MAG TPA: hypothetical protein PLP29_00450 [Candidatus Ozemobacteraceae bacterium]|nr:hypothetical protein [Candidatus Ozemobacteraceae bacterium]